jgi:predicted AlkP superfamily pyrophosphatase or phosphodiesterase
MMDEGSFIDTWIYHTTDTKASHTQMLTGYTPEVTGVYANWTYKPIPEGYTIFEKLEYYFGRDNVNTVMLTGKSHHIGSLAPEQTRAELTALRAENRKRQEAMKRSQEEGAPPPDITRRDPTVPNPFGEPFYRARQGIDVWDGDIERDAEVVGPTALRYLETYTNKRFFMFFHFRDTDEAGHAHTENSDEYTQAIIKCDVWTGKIMGKLKDLGRVGDTTVIVTTDHGFNEGTIGHLWAPHTWLVSTKKGFIGPADQIDIAPTILDLMGVNVGEMQPPFPPFPGQLLTQPRRNPFVEPKTPNGWEERLQDLKRRSKLQIENQKKKK